MGSELLEHSWTDAREGLQVRFGQECFQRWLADITVISSDAGHVRLGVANRFLQEWIETRYLDGIREVLEGQAGRELDLDIAIDPVLFRKHRKEQEKVFAPNGGAAVQPAGKAGTPAWRGGRVRGNAGAPRSDRGESYELANFVQGESNRLAYRAVIEAARSPGSFYNPLFIWGGSGVGKTHLLRGMEREVGANLKTRCVNSERFFNHFAASIQDGSIDRFRRLYRGLDLLLIDDVQDLSSKKKTQVELLHTIDYLVSSGRQVVITSSRGPRELDELSPALRGRFLGGLVARIRPVDYQMKRKIIRHHWARLELRGGQGGFSSRGELDSQVLDLLAHGIRGGIHELLGAVLQLDVHARVLGRPLDSAEARRVLADRMGAGAPGPTLDRIKQEVADYFNLPTAEFSSSNRLRPVAFARQVAIYLARRFTRMSFSEIGRNFGNRNHTTVRCAVGKIAGLLEDGDPMACTPVYAIIDRLEG